MAEDRLMASARKMQVKMMVGYVLDKTSSATEDEFIERFSSGVKVTDNLRGLQSQADGKLALLKTEHQELYDTWSVEDYTPKAKVNIRILYSYVYMYI
jgi:hypothetical protein